ncbi:B1 protein-like [Aphomia sociella]
MKSFLCLVVLAIASCNAITRDELDKIQESMLPYIKECSTQFGVSEDELKAAKQTGNVEGVEPCLIGCVFKKAGFVDGDGKFLADKVKELSKKYISKDEDQKTFDSIIDTCSSDDEITESDAACVRSKRVLECFTKHRAELKVSR